MTSAHQAARHVRTHPAQAHHSQSHTCSSVCIKTLLYYTPAVECKAGYGKILLRTNLKLVETRRAILPVLISGRYRDGLVELGAPALPAPRNLRGPAPPLLPQT